MHNFILRCMVKNIFSVKTISVRASNNGKGEPENFLRALFPEMIFM